MVDSMFGCAACTAAIQWGRFLPGRCPALTSEVVGHVEHALVHTVQLLDLQTRCTLQHSAPAGWQGLPRNAYGVSRLHLDLARLPNTSQVCFITLLKEHSQGRALMHHRKFVHSERVLIWRAYQIHTKPRIYTFPWAGRKAGARLHPGDFIYPRRAVSRSARAVDADHIQARFQRLLAHAAPHKAVPAKHQQLRQPRH